MLLLGIIAVYTLFPFYWAIVSSLKTGSTLFEVDPWPTAPAWSNYTAVFTAQPFGQNIFNSVIVASAVVIVSLKSPSSVLSNRTILLSPSGCMPEPIVPATYGPLQVWAYDVSTAHHTNAVTTQIASR